MRSLTPTLLAAQRSASRVPCLKVEAVNKIAGVVRLEWSRLYSGNEPDYHHALAMPADGSLVRARVDSSTYQLNRQRVASPGQGSDFSAWTPVCQVSDVSGIALAASGATVLLFYVDTDQNTVCCQESPDSGASFGSQTAIATAASAVGWLAAAISDSVVVAVFYSVGGAVYIVKRSSGVWGAPAIWSNSLAEISGLAASYQGDWNLAVCGKDAGGRLKVCTCIYGDGYAVPPGSWSALKELQMASADSGMEFKAPSLACTDVFRLFYTESYSGAQSYSRPCWTHALASAEFGANKWREPVPFDFSTGYGLALASHGSYAWLSAPSGAWRALLTPLTVDLSPDILRLTAKTSADSGQATIELRNDDGRYQSPGSGSLAALKAGSEIYVSPGYVTPEGEETSSGVAYWLEGWEHASSGGSSCLRLEALDGWSLLARWKARRQYTWPAGDSSVYELLGFVLARCGLELTAKSTSDLMLNLSPTFTIHPEETGFHAAQRLLSMTPDVLFFQGGAACIKCPAADDEPEYSYGEAHSVMEGSYKYRAYQGNRVQVYGNGLMVEAFQWNELSGAHDRLLQVHDKNLSNPDDAAERATAELRSQELEAVGGEIRAPINCGQELYDVIEITDSRAGLAAAKRRVIGMTLDYSTGKQPRYEHRLELGGV